MTIGLTVGSVGITLSQTSKNYPQTKIVMTINARIDSAFNYIVPIPLPHIFKKYKNLPAIVKTDETEKWAKAGLKRTIYFEDGSTSKETLLTVVPHSSFSYKIEDFTSQLRFLAKRIEGDWLFTDLGNGQTKIEWTYKIVPKNFIFRGLVNLFLMKNINGLLNNASTILKIDLERQTQSLNNKNMIKTSISDNSSSVLTITKVKKPWYAWRGVVVKKMVQTIPEYIAIKGLNEKWYSFTENHKLFGGIYFWQSEEFANKWFNQSWYDQTEKSYGQKGIVEYYNIVRIDNFANVQTQNCHYWAVMTQYNSEHEQPKSNQGLIRNVVLKGKNNENYYLSIWVNKNLAISFFKNKNVKCEFYDTPIYLNNRK